MKYTKTKRVVIWGYHHDSDIEAIKSIEKDKAIDIIKWFGNHKIFDYNLNKLIHNPYPEIIDKTHLILGNKYDEELREYFDLFVEGYSRISFSRAKSNQELWHLFYMYSHYFYTLLHNRVDIVLFQNLPHHGIDVILYAVAKVLDIRTVLTTQSLLENKFWYIEDIKDFGVFKNTIGQKQLSLSIEKSFDKDLFYMKNIKIKKTICLASLLTDFIKIKTRKLKKPITLSGVLQKYKECKSYKEFSKKSYVKKLDFDKKYIYFPLQMQPELTTSVLGEKYVDQILAIEHLSLLIPEDWVIYIKENPMQTSRQRDELFYQRLKNIKNTYYVPLNYNTHYLIEHSQFVAVVTGTAGWEAISGGKNVLVFAQAWYKTLPGVFTYKTDISFNSILEYKIVHKELETKYSELMSKTFEGIVDPDYIRMYPEYSQKENVKYIKTFLLNVLFK